LIDKEYLWKYFILGADHNKIDGAVLWQYRDVSESKVNDLLRPYMIYKVSKMGGLAKEISEQYVNFVLISLCDEINISSSMYIDCKMFYDSLPSMSPDAKSAVMINFSFYVFKCTYR